ncbi:MAG: IS21 family transposase [Gammaproteobacteria bacterium]|nr:IS21 family transposase [Gammaproteobacteria bacterium]NIT16192.1 IS21 family transposase [Gammaproteobacteria bacterium]
MIDVALISVIRRWHLREGVSIREIARRTKLSRNTIRKYLADGELEPRYPKRKSPSKLDPYAPVLASWLEREATRGRKQRRNLRELYGDLVALGYRGSYDRVAAFARVWRVQQQEAARASRGTYVPLVFAPGEAFQFDWSEDWAVIGGERTKLAVAQFRLCHSRAFVLRAYRLQGHEMLFDAHNRCLATLGGVPRRGIYDNMKTAVDRVGRGKVRVVNARFRAMTGHFLFEAEFCTPAAGWEKGQIEKQVRDARPRIWHEVPKFADLQALNEWLARRCLALWHEIRHPEQPGRTVAEVWAEEQAHLMKMPLPFDGFLEHTKRVSPTSLVAFERNRYSVPASFANRPVSLRAYADRIVIAAEGQVVAEHRRVFSRGHDRPVRTIYDWRHYLAVLQRKPGALRNGAPFAELPEVFRRLQAVLLKRPGGDREMVEILALVLHHDERTVLSAVEQAFETGSVSKQHVLNLLSRLLDAEPPAPIDAPAGLRLANEPKANVRRYDHLRGQAHAR